MNGFHPTRLCGAKTRAGTPCRRPAMPNGRCDKHGGKTPAGIASPHFKHGRYSHVLPARLLDAYHHARNDPEMLSAREHLALYAARIEDLLARLDTGESLGYWRKARALIRAYDKALRADDQAALASIWSDLREVVTAAQHDWATWREVDNAVQMYAKAAARERQRLLDLEQLVSAEEAARFGAAVVGAVRRHVTDPVVLAAIQDDLMAIYEARMREDEP